MLRRVAAAARPDQSEKERAFESALVDAGIVPHFLAARETPKDPEDFSAGFTLAQQGVDVNIALDCLDMAHSDQFDVAVLIAGDEDFVPLVRKLTALGKRVIIAYFEIEEWKDENEHSHRATFCSRKLRDAASYTLNLNQLVDDSNWKNDMKALFIRPASHHD